VDVTKTEGEAAETESPEESWEDKRQDDTAAQIDTTESTPTLED